MSNTSSVSNTSSQVALITTRLMHTAAGHVEVEGMIAAVLVSLWHATCCYLVLNMMPLAALLLEARQLLLMCLLGIILNTNQPINQPGDKQADKHHSESMSIIRRTCCNGMPSVPALALAPCITILKLSSLISECRWSVRAPRSPTLLWHQQQPHPQPNQTEPNRTKPKPTRSNRRAREQTEAKRQRRQVVQSSAMPIKNP